MTVFADIPDTHRASHYATYALGRGVLDDLYEIRSDRLRHFSPDNAITRNQAVQMMVATYETMYGLVTISADFSSKLSDVSLANPYYASIIKAEYLGIIE